MSIKDMMVSCPEEIAFERGRSISDELKKSASRPLETEYGRHLTGMAEERSGER